ncbi:S1 family peptidase [Kribbella deserti]|uniref:Serine protease n=1 Tax=Kribbella deserti TaxID=1926257 RepID=A0ABV6QF48_9ACTN
MSASATRFHGRILDVDGRPVGTCFHLGGGVLATALHVVYQASADGVVRFEPLADSAAGEGTGTAALLASDADHDLAILRTATPPSASVELVAMSDDQDSGLPISLTGYALLSSGHSYRIMPSSGRWEGPSKEEGGPATGWVYADGVQPGMSGAPLIRQHDGAVIGVLIDRFETDEIWSAGRVRTARTERLLELLAGHTTVAVESKAVRALKPADRLAEQPLDRAKLRADRTIVVPVSWKDEREKGSAALGRGDVVVVVAPPGIGSTTFAEQLVAHEAPAEMLMTAFDPDWEHPTVAALRPKAGYVHVLDVETSVDLGKARAFVVGLTELAGIYRDMNARLVLTVRTEFWRSVVSGSIPEVHVIQLEEAPDSVQVVGRRLGVITARLQPHVDADTVKPYLKGLSAVQATRAAARILDAWRSWPDQDDDSQWAQRLHKLLDNHVKTLDGLFLAPESALSPEDRCFLLALACVQSVRLSELDDLSTSLAARLQATTDDKDKVKESAFAVFSRPGLVGRVNAIQAKILPGEIVVFKESAFGDAAVRYAWDNFPPIRKPMADWLIGLAVKDAGRQNLVQERLSGLVIRHQDVGFIKNELKELTSDSRWLLEEVLLAGAKDPHMQRGCEQLLYGWATTAGLRSTVVTVASRMLLEGVRTEIAVRRLQRVADATEDPGIDKAVQEAFEAALQVPGIRGTVAAAFAKWLRDNAAARSAKIALRALMAVDTGDIPWLLSEQASDIDLILVLREALADRTSHPALAAIVSRASIDDARYNGMIDALARALVGLGSLVPFRLYEAFVGYDFNGRTPEADLDAKFKIILASDDEPPSVA